MEMSLKIVALRRCCENIELDYMSLNDNYLASAKRVSQAEGREFEPRLPLEEQYVENQIVKPEFRRICCVKYCQVP